LQARNNGEEQRDGVAASAHGKSKRPYAALQRWQAARILFYFIFFLLDSFKKRTRAR